MYFNFLSIKSHRSTHVTLVSMSLICLPTVIAYWKRLSSQSKSGERLKLIGSDGRIIPLTDHDVYHIDCGTVTMVTNFEIDSQQSEENLTTIERILKLRVKQILKSNPWLCGRFVTKKIMDLPSNVQASHLTNDGCALIGNNDETTVALWEPGHTTWEHFKEPCFEHIQVQNISKALETPTAYLIKNGKDVVDKDEPLWKVTLLSSSCDNLNNDKKIKNDDNKTKKNIKFALVVSMSHGLGDAATWYRIYNMLNGGAHVETSLCDRVFKTELSTSETEFRDRLYQESGLLQKGVNKIAFYEILSSFPSKSLKEISCLFMTRLKQIYSTWKQQYIQWKLPKMKTTFIAVDPDWIDFQKHKFDLEQARQQFDSSSLLVLSNSDASGGVSGVSDESMLNVETTENSDSGHGSIVNISVGQPFISTNDLLIAYLMPKQALVKIAINMRNRISSYLEKCVGNYSLAINLYPKDLTNATTVRSLIKSKLKTEFNGGQKEIHTIFNNLQERSGVGILTNWASFYCELEIPYCHVTDHYPLLSSIDIRRFAPLVQRTAVVYKKDKDNTAAVLLSHEGDDISECMKVGYEMFPFAK